MFSYGQRSKCADLLNSYARCYFQSGSLSFFSLNAQGLLKSPQAVLLPESILLQLLLRLFQLFLQLFYSALQLVDGLLHLADVFRVDLL